MGRWWCGTGGDVGAGCGVGQDMVWGRMWC